MSAPYCKDCRHFREAEIDGYTFAPVCARVSHEEVTESLIYGPRSRRIHLTCEDARANNSLCGSEGVLFEKRLSFRERLLKRHRPPRTNEFC